MTWDRIILALYAISGAAGAYAFVVQGDWYAGSAAAGWLCALMARAEMSR